MDYLIDPQIISYFLRKPLDSAEVAEYVEKYQAKLTEMTKSIISEYLITEKGVKPEEVEDMIAQFFNPDVDDDDSPLLDEELLAKLSTVQEDLNSKIYQYYNTQLTPEEQQKVNEYLEQSEKEADMQLELQKQEMAKMIKEVEQDLTDVFDPVMRDEALSIEEVLGER